MNITVPIYEERLSDGQLVWRTVGLGPYNEVHRARHPGKVRARLVESLQRSLHRLATESLPLLEFHRGTKLESVRLDMKLAGAQKVQVYGQFPLIIETRTPTPDQKLRIAYHPLRQNDWFIASHYPTLSEQAEIFFGDRWQGQPASVIEQLQKPRHCRLHAVNVTIRPATLLHRLQKKTEPKAKLGPAPKPSGGLKVLPEVGTNLSRRACDDDLPSVTSREPYRTRLEQRLRGSGRRAIVLVGPSGVGKTSLVYQFVDDLLDEDGYSEHRNFGRCRQVWSAAGRRIIAGMSYVGQWEERCLELLDDLQRQRVLLYVPDIHAWGRIGQTVSSERCLADFFRGPVARGEAPIVAEATAEQWQRLEADAPAFANLFTVVEVREPPHGETLGMLMHRVRELEDEQPVNFRPLALRTIMELGESLFASRAFPGKALELLDGLAGTIRGPAKERQEIGPKDVFEAASRRTGMPRDVLQDKRSLSGQKLRRDFERYVMGQTEAVDAVVDVILRIKSGLTNPKRPHDVMLFCGPTGTGKTELAKCLASYLYGGSDRMLRFDMSEFAGPDAASRLVGHRHSPDGLLTSAVRRQPFCVVLFDEIEKAHPTILNLLLQVFDEGRLTDAAGKVADFSHTVIIMTSNLGARSSAPVGFGEDAKSVVNDMKAAVEAFFAPELFNRIDHVVGFGPLARDVARIIADKELGRLLARHGLLERRIYARATPAVLDRIVEGGFDERDGARSLKRYLDRHLGSKMAEEIATGGQAQMRMFHVYQDDVGFRLHGEALKEAPLVGGSMLTSLFDADDQTLRDELTRARDNAKAMATSERLAEISELLRRHLAQYNAGRSGVADEIYSIDVMRDSLEAFCEELDRMLGVELWDDAEIRQLELMDRTAMVKDRDWMGVPILARFFNPRALPAAPRPPTRDDVLLAVAESRFLERALAGVDELWRHGVTVTLSVVGEADGGERFGASKPGLIDWFARSIVSDRGEVEGCAALVDGEVVSGESAKVLGGEYEGHLREVVISVVGLSVYDWFAADHGCHILEALGSSSQVVRVEVVPEAADATAALEARQQQRRAFADALDAGASELPDNPDALLPIVRQYRWEPNSRAEIEDFRLAWAATMQASSFFDIAERLRAMYQAIEADEVDDE